MLSDLRAMARDLPTFTTVTDVQSIPNSVVDNTWNIDEGNTITLTLNKCPQN